MLGQVGHDGGGRPGTWMPDQVGHDGAGLDARPGAAMVIGCRVRP